MKFSAPNQNRKPTQGWFRFRLAAATLAGCTILTGCSVFTGRKAHQAPDLDGRGPANVYASTPVLPSEVRRIAVLPLTSDASYADLIEGCEELEPVLNAEITKTEKFEVVRVSVKELTDCTGRLGWTGSEALAPDFFSTLHDTFGCDAVLFCELTEFRPYAPLMIGWRLKLVEVRTRQILWAGDQVFDAGQPAAQVKARRYESQQQRSAKDSSDGWIMENSPRRFGQFTAARLLATLPSR